MKYILLDTNIYLDLIANRPKGINKKSRDIMEKLLEWKQCKLIIPEVVMHEIDRNIDNILSLLDKNLKDVKKAMDKSYWIDFSSHSIFEYEINKKKIETHIGKLIDLFKNERASIKTDIKEWFNSSIYSNENVIIVDTNETLIKKVTKRRFHKDPPFHKKQTEYGDALILETILNCRDLIKDFSEKDKLYFISRNYEDFCEVEKKEKVLHSFIIKDIDNAGLKNNVIYSPYFYKTLNDDFQMEIENVEQLENQMLDQQAEYYESYMQGYEDYCADRDEVFEDYDNH